MVNKILVSKKVSYGKNNSFKYFIGYNDNDIIRPLFVKLPQTTSYINKFKDKKTKITTTTMSLMVKDKQRFKNYNKIWEKIESLMRKKFDSKPFYGNDDNNYIKTKVKTFKDSIITNFRYKKVPGEKIPYKCLSIIVLDSVIKADNTARKTIFPRSWNIIESSKRPRKYHFSINFLAEKRPYFPSPKSLKQELLSNQ